MDYRTPRALFALVPVMAFLAGCAAPPPATVPIGAPSIVASEAVAEGDWDDVDASVRTATRLEQIAIEFRRAYRTAGGDAESVIVFGLRTVRGDSGELRLKRLPDDTIRVRCRIGAMGSADAEGKLVAEVVARLERLHGRDYAPLPG